MKSRHLSRGRAVLALLSATVIATPHAAVALDLGCVAVQGRALDPYGQGIAGATVQVYDDACSDTTANPYRATSDGTGRWLVFGKRPTEPRTGLPGTHITVNISHARFSSTNIEAKPNLTTDAVPNDQVPAENVARVFYRLEKNWGLDPAVSPGGTVNVQVKSGIPLPTDTPPGRLLLELPTGTVTDFAPGSASGALWLWNASIVTTAQTPEGKYNFSYCAVKHTYTGKCSDATVDDLLAYPTFGGSYVVDATPPVISSGRLLPMSGGNAVAAGQPLSAKVSDTSSGVVASGVTFTLTDATTGVTTTHPATNESRGWFRSNAVTLTDGHVYRIAVRARDRAGNEATVAQGPVDEGGGFRAVSLTNLGSTARSSTKVVTRPCDVGAIDPATLTRSVKCANVRIEFSGVPVTMSGTRHGGFGDLRQYVSLYNLYIYPTIQGSRIGQSPITPLPYDGREVKQRFRVEGPRSSAFTVNTEAAAVVIPEVTATIGAAADGAVIEMEAKPATATSVSCTVPSIETAWCTPDPIAPVADLGGQAVLDVIPLPGGVVAASTAQGGFVGQYGTGLSFTRQLNQTGADSGDAVDDLAATPPGDGWNDVEPWQWFARAGWGGNDIELVAGRMLGGETLDSLARAADRDELTSGSTQAAGPGGGPPGWEQNPGYYQNCIIEGGGDDPLQSRGCWERRMGDWPETHRYIGDKSWAYMRGSGGNIQSKSLTTEHTYEKGLITNWNPGSTRFTECDEPGSQPVTLTLGDHGVSLSLELMICADMLDPVLVHNPAADLAERFTTKWQRYGGGAYGSQQTEQMNIVKVEPNDVPSGFEYHYKPEWHVPFCWSCFITI